MFMILILGLLLFFTLRTYARQGSVAATFYFVSQAITLWVIVTDRLPWYCILLLIIGNVWVMSGFKTIEVADKPSS